MHARTRGQRRTFTAGEAGGVGTIILILFVLLALVGGYLGITLGPHYFKKAKLQEALDSDEFALAYRMPRPELERKVVATARDIGLGRIEGRHITIDYPEVDPPAVDILVEYTVLEEVIPGVWTFQKHFEVSARREKSGVANFIDQTESAVIEDIEERADETDKLSGDHEADGSGQLTIIDEDSGEEESDDDEGGEGGGGEPGRRGLTGWAQKARDAVNR